jgi:hypothetical protein
MSAGPGRHSSQQAGRRHPDGNTIISHIIVPGPEEFLLGIEGHCRDRRRQGELSRGRERDGGDLAGIRALATYLQGNTGPDSVRELRPSAAIAEGTGNCSSRHWPWLQAGRGLRAANAQGTYLLPVSVHLEWWRIVRRRSGGRRWLDGIAERRRAREGAGGETATRMQHVGMDFAIGYPMFG